MGKTKRVHYKPYQGPDPNDTQVKIMHGTFPSQFDGLEWKLNLFIKENKKKYRIKITGYSLTHMEGDSYREGVILYLVPIRVSI